MACVVLKHFDRRLDEPLHSTGIKNSKHFHYAKRIRSAQWQMLYVKSEFSVQVYCNKVMRKSYEEFVRSTLHWQTNSEFQTTVALTLEAFANKWAIHETHESVWIKPCCCLVIKFSDRKKFSISLLIVLKSAVFYMYIIKLRINLNFVSNGWVACGSYTYGLHIPAQ